MLVVCSQYIGSMCVTVHTDCRPLLALACLYCGHLSKPSHPPAATLVHLSCCCSRARGTPGSKCHWLTCLHHLTNSHGQQKEIESANSRRAQYRGLEPAAPPPHRATICLSTLNVTYSGSSSCYTTLGGTFDQDITRSNVRLVMNRAVVSFDILVGCCHCLALTGRQYAVVCRPPPHTPS